MQLIQRIHCDIRLVCNILNKVREQQQHTPYAGRDVTNMGQTKNFFQDPKTFKDHFLKSCEYKHFEQEKIKLTMFIVCVLVAFVLCNERFT